MGSTFTKARLSVWFFAIIALVSVSTLSAQGGPGMGMGQGSQGVMGASAVRAWFRALSLTDNDLDALDKILDADEIELAKAQNEIAILQIKIANMLLNQKPDLDAIDDAISKSLAYEKTVRMIQIKRQVAIRNVFGEERWQSILLIVREAKMSEKAGKFANSFSAKGLEPDEARRYARLLNALRRIM